MFFFFQAEDGIRFLYVTGVQTCALPISRLRKRGERGLDAIVLACAGLDRLGLAGEIGRRFEPAEVLPEAGQGALALQVRAGEEELVARAEIGRASCRE